MAEVNSWEILFCSLLNFLVLLMLILYFLSTWNTGQQKMGCKFHLLPFKLLVNLFYLFDRPVQYFYAVSYLWWDILGDKKKKKKTAVATWVLLLPFVYMYELSIWLTMSIMFFVCNFVFSINPCALLIYQNEKNEQSS